MQTVLAADTAAIYMGAGEAPAISHALIKGGKPPATAVAVIENASLGAAVARGTLAELPQLAAQLSGGPVLILLGEVLRKAVSAAQRAKARRRLAR